MFIFNFLKYLFIFFPVISDVIDSFIKQKEALADRYGIAYRNNNSIISLLKNYYSSVIKYTGFDFGAFY
jgi:hypothetical protein